MTDVPLDPSAAAVARLIAGLITEVPAHLLRALHRPVLQDVFAEGGRRLGVRRRTQRLVGYLAIGGAGWAVFPVVDHAPTDHAHLRGPAPIGAGHARRAAAHRRAQS